MRNRTSTVYCTRRASDYAVITQRHAQSRGRLCYGEQSSTVSPPFIVVHLAASDSRIERRNERCVRCGGDATFGSFSASVRLWNRYGTLRSVSHGRSHARSTSSVDEQRKRARHGGKKVDSSSFRRRYKENHAPSRKRSKSHSIRILNESNTLYRSFQHFVRFASRI